MDGEHLKIDLGSGNPEEGEIQPEGFILQDIAPHKGITLVCDILALVNHIKPGQCSHIRASHVLEHFSTKTIPTLFKMIHTLLESEGIFEIHSPNFKWHGALLLEDRDEEAVNYAYGSQKDEFDYHKTAFTSGILYKRLTEAGFQLVGITIEHSLHAIAKKI
jgi:predicted SAM-dependent methyltransferase